MKYLSFLISNFKGIERAQLSLEPSGSNVFTLIGLNESGKTTILEAISVFGQYMEDADYTKALYADETGHDAPATFVPKHKKSNFTGEIQIQATVQFDSGDAESVAKLVEAETGGKIKAQDIPKKFTITRKYKFENSDFTMRENLWAVNLLARAKGSRKDRRQGSDSAIWKSFTIHTNKKLPQIVYFPTFLFSQPTKVELNPSDEEGAINRQYREIIENVARSLPRPLDVKKHIVERIVNPETLSEVALSFFGLAADKREQVDAAMSELSAHITKTVFESWSKIFGGTFTGREIVLRPGVGGTTTSPVVYLQFLLKDGTSIYEISERSLGFRWFFTFLLFTFYRASAKKERPILFLLDEPASNLHSGAQMQLIDSFPKIATGSNQIIYSTHSHYMINPDWLDQAFIVSNSAVDYEDVSELNAIMRNRPTNIHVARYRDFVGKNPDKMTYFQPVLDKLDVLPSRIDIVRPSVVVEGKGDYLILEYGRRVLLEIEETFSIVPTRGATGMDEIIGLLRGWAVPFSICLDADNEGKKAVKSYRESWGLSSDVVFDLSDVSADLRGKSVEGLLEKEDLDLIANYFGSKKTPTKSQVRLFFSENLARKQKQNLSQKYFDRVAAFQARVVKSLKS